MKKRSVSLVSLLLMLVTLAACGNRTGGEQSAAPSSSLTVSPAPAAEADRTVPENLRRARTAVEPFFKLMGEPEPDEWLATYPETGQTFEQYLAENPTRPTAARKILYVQPLGKFDGRERRIIDAAAVYMSDFFNLPVKMLPVQNYAEPLSLKNYRIHPAWKTKQIRSGYIIDELLFPALPADAAALIAFTDADLYPDKSMNFVFGQANLQNRVGVWSLYHLGSRADYQTFLKRTLKIAVHETGYMFSIRHCAKYQCVMSGTNHLAETDKRPIDACPECMAKICWMSDSAPRPRFQKLAAASRKIGLAAEAEEFEQKAAEIEEVASR